MNLKKGILSLAFGFLLMENILAQDTAHRHMFRIYEDNDFLNITGNGTDNSYTNGTRFDFFYNNMDVV